MAKIHELRHKLLPYSPDLAPSDFNLFSKLKIFLSGPRFSTTEELIPEMEGYFAGLEESHFWDGIKALEHRWTKCIILQGDCVEKQKHFYRGKTLLSSTFQELFKPPSLPSLPSLNNPHWLPPDLHLAVLTHLATAVPPAWHVSKRLLLIDKGLHEVEIVWASTFICAYNLSGNCFHCSSVRAIFSFYSYFRDISIFIFTWSHLPRCLINYNNLTTGAA